MVPLAYLRPNSLNALTLGAPSALGRAPTDQMMSNFFFSEMSCRKVSTISITGYQHFDLIETRPAAFSVARSSQIETPVWLIEMETVENIVILTIEPKAILW